MPPAYLTTGQSSIFFSKLSTTPDVMYLASDLKLGSDLISRAFIVQGYLAHKKTPLHRTLQKAYRDVLGLRLQVGQRPVPREIKLRSFYLSQWHLAHKKLPPSSIGPP